MLLRTRCDCKFNGTAAVVQGRRQGPEPAALLPLTAYQRATNTARQDREREGREGTGRGVGRKGAVDGRLTHVGLFVPWPRSKQIVSATPKRRNTACF